MKCLALSDLAQQTSVQVVNWWWKTCFTPITITIYKESNITRTQVHVLKKDKTSNKNSIKCMFWHTKKTPLFLLPWTPNSPTWKKKQHTWMAGWGKPLYNANTMVPLWLMYYWMYWKCWRNCYWMMCCWWKWNLIGQSNDVLGGNQALLTACQPPWSLNKASFLAGKLLVSGSVYIYI